MAYSGRLGIDMRVSRLYTPMHLASGKQVESEGSKRSSDCQVGGGKYHVGTVQARTVIPQSDEVRFEFKHEGAIDRTAVGRPFQVSTK